MLAAHVFTPQSGTLLYFSLLSLLWMMHKNVGQIRWAHSCSALIVLREKAKSFVIDFIPPALPRDCSCSSHRAHYLWGRERERERKGGQLHLWMLNKCITVWALCPGLSGLRTWNVPVRQSGAAGAWQLAAGGDNLLSGGERGGAAEDSPPPVDTSLRPWDVPVQRERERSDTASSTAEDF